MCFRIPAHKSTTAGSVQPALTGLLHQEPKRGVFPKTNTGKTRAARIAQWEANEPHGGAIGSNPLSLKSR